MYVSFSASTAGPVDVQGKTLGIMTNPGTAYSTTKNTKRWYGPAKSSDMSDTAAKILSSAQVGSNILTFILFLSKYILLLINNVN